MINLKKLAMISAMGMVLSTSTMAADTDGTQAVGTTVLDPITVTVADEAADSFIGSKVEQGDSIAIDKVKVKYTFSGTDDETPSTITIPTGSFTLTTGDGSGDDKKIVIHLAETHDAKFGATDAGKLYVTINNDEAFDIRGTQEVGAYTKDLIVTVGY
jgi:hypothetical protein